MTAITLSFEVHQPLRIEKNFTEDMGRGKSPEDLLEVYFNNTWNKEIFLRAAKKCYRPATQIILENIKMFKGKKKEFKVAFSLSGVFIEQCRRWAPDVLDLFRKIADTECAEFLCQTYYHSLSSIFSAERGEFMDQVLEHRRAIMENFYQTPKVFENTEFIYNNSIAKTVSSLGFEGIFTEGAERILGWRSPNYVYRAKDAPIKVLLRNYRLSDDISFRFSNRDWEGWPMTADKFSYWLACTPGDCINLFMDYETFGEHQWPETGIHEFLRWLPGEILKHENLEFKTPSELIKKEAVGEIDVHDFDTVSWADVKRSTDAWLGNDMQRTSFEAVKNLEPFVRATKNSVLLKIWRLLQTSDHIYYMYTEPGASGLVHGYFSQQFPTEAFWSFLRILSDFYMKVSENLSGRLKEAAKLLRVLPPDRAFHFHEDGRYIGLSAHSLEELKNALPYASETSILFHMACKHFEKWIRFTIGDSELADKISKAEGRSAAELRERIYELINRRILELKSVVE